MNLRPKVLADDRATTLEVMAYHMKELELKDGDIALSLIHFSEPTRRTPNSYSVFCLNKKTDISISLQDQDEKNMQQSSTKNTIQ
ncbi:hypothetical protein HpBGD38_14940 [Helicobacter pylori]